MKEPTTSPCPTVRAVEAEGQSHRGNPRRPSRLHQLKKPRNSEAVHGYEVYSRETRASDCRRLHPPAELFLSPGAVIRAILVPLCRLVALLIYISLPLSSRSFLQAGFFVVLDYRTIVSRSSQPPHPGCRPQGQNGPQSAQRAQKKARRGKENQHLKRHRLL